MINRYRLAVAAAAGSLAMLGVGGVAFAHAHQAEDHQQGQHTEIHGTLTGAISAALTSANTLTITTSTGTVTVDLSPSTRIEFEGNVTEAEVTGGTAVAQVEAQVVDQSGVMTATEIHIHVDGPKGNDHQGQQKQNDGKAHSHDSQGSRH